MAGLTSPQAFDYPPLDVQNKHKQIELEKILRIPKEVCGIHELPFAQTWALSASSSVACHEQILEMTCNSFDSKCLKKVCMSTAALPFHVRDLSKWAFRTACKEQHLEKSKGVVGHAMLSHGSCFCGDVTKLSEDEYPLVYKARMSRLSSCFAIFLHSIEFDNDYVLEFFLPLDMEDGRGLPNLTHALKKNIELASGFELGDVSRLQIVGSSNTDVSFLSLNTHPHTIQISSNATSKSNISEMISSDSESMVTNSTKTKSENLSNQWSLEQNNSNNYSDKITATENLAVDLFRGDDDVSAAIQYDNNTSYPDASMQKKSDTFTEGGDKRDSLKQGRKRKIDPLTKEAVQKHLGTPIDEAAKSLNGKLKPPINGADYIYRVARLKMQLRQWRNKISVRHALQKRDHPTVSERTSKTEYITNPDSHFDWQLPEPILVHASPKQNGADFIYQVALLKMQLRQWRNKISIRHSLQKRDHPTVSRSTTKPKYTTNITNMYSNIDLQLPESNLIHAYPKHNVSEIRMVTIKATHKDDMIKFRFPISSGLLELENQVAQRINVKIRRFCLNYMDEDNDLILLACDADLRNLLRFPGSNGTFKLFITMVDE